MKRRGILLVPVILSSMFLLTGCPSSGSSSTSNGQAYDISEGIVADNSRSASGSAFDLGATDNYKSGAGVPKTERTESADEESDYDGDTMDGESIKREMLVYRGSIRIKTDDFNNSVNKFRQDIRDMGGFIEHQDLDTGWNMYDTRRTLQQFTATVRIPSKNYQTVMEGASAYGKVMSSTSDVENIAKEYASASASLEVYQTKYERYLELMRQADNMTDMIEIEREITEIERMINSYKSQLEVMDTDVAYSTIEVTISNRIDDLEVAEDTFISRLGKACKDSLRWFITWIENVIIFIILYWWYIAILIGIVVLIIRSRKNWVKKHPQKVKKVQKFSYTPDGRAIPVESKTAEDSVAEPKDDAPTDITKSDDETK